MAGKVCIDHGDTPSGGGAVLNDRVAFLFLEGDDGSSQVVAYNEDDYSEGAVAEGHSEASMALAESLLVVIGDQAAPAWQATIPAPPAAATAAPSTAEPTPAPTAAEPAIKPRRDAGPSALVWTLSCAAAVALVALLLVFAWHRRGRYQQHQKVSTVELAAQRAY
ncbi:Hypothetical Protein FCC1311_115632 [Hondaea fermentalgiana]|uniref:Uncharacterized protein n=1 Tax=Hondaea fermentalgiana TaxID=2315210 RepID=A0A2R5FIS2_9STRA|nr:Hypothetical Protein FCC1311_115632 [Hondaea fermentalgiana]|eukprot:GBG16073.1 Hypothetical Protein FCC1311_115632 [Hondaea fermentalgiana]